MLIVNSDLGCIVQGTDACDWYYVIRTEGITSTISKYFRKTMKQFTRSKNPFLWFFERLW